MKRSEMPTHRPRREASEGETEPPDALDLGFQPSELGGNQRAV